MLAQICSLVDSGLSFHSVESVICNQYRQHYWRLQRRFSEACVRLGSSFKSFPEFSQGTFPYPHEILLKDIFMAYSSLFLHTFHADMAVRTSSWISCDHTFKSAANIGFVRKSDGKWIKLFKCVFCVMGIDGSVIHWRFTRGESFEEVRDLFVELRSRFNSRNISCQGIVIDNCCKWKGMLNGIFHNVQVKLDLFHAVQRFQRTLSSDIRLRSGICREYGLVFRRADDLGEKRLKETPDKETILRNLESFEKKWMSKKINGKSVINSEGKNAIQLLKVHINRGCLSGIPAHASTSGNERLHRRLNYAIRTNRISVEMALIRCSRLFFVINNANRDIQSFLSFPSSSGASSEGCGVVDCFGVRNKGENCSTDSYLQEGVRLKEYKSLWEMTSKEVSDLKQIIASSITGNSGDTSDMLPLIDGEHSYYTEDVCDSTNDTALEMAVAALNFYSIFNGLENLGCEKFLTQSKLPASIGLGAFGTKNVQLLTSSAVSLPPEHASHSESILTGHLEGFGLSRVPVAGDGNCFFTAVAFQLHQLMSSTDVPTLVVNSLSSIGITTNMTIPQLASLLRKLVVEEWISDHIDNYINFVSDSVDFLAEVKKFEQSGYHVGPLGDLMPMAMANVLHMPLAIVTLEPHSPLISICPSGSPITGLPLFLAYNSFGAGHYDGAILVTKDVSFGKYG